MEASERQIAYAEDIVKKLDITLPASAYSDIEEMSEFIETYKDEASKLLPLPSPKQIAFAEKLADEKEMDLPADYKTERAACSEFIEECLAK